MPVYQLSRELCFPDPELAQEDGLLAVGGDLSPQRLLTAYAMGIFPWYSAGLPILWHSPDPRFVLYTGALHVGRSLRKTMRKEPFVLRLDTAFRDVIDACACVPRAGQPGTWITDEMKEGYTRLHDLGFAHSVEAWRDGELVGGLYGVALGQMYFGESMFAKVDDASKVAFVALVHQLSAWGFDVIDSQVYTDHLARFGAREIPRREYLDLLSPRLREPGRRGHWTFDQEILDGLSGGGSG